MVSLFGQVWLWSLLSFVAGVLVTWLVQVRPAKQRLAELEANRLGAYAGPVRQQSQAPPSQVSSPIRDDEFDDWHVGARANSDPLSAVPPPVPDQVWPQSLAREAPQAYGAPQAYEQPRLAEPPRPLEPQRLIEPFHVSEQPNNYAEPFVPASAFGRLMEPEPEPEPDNNYDELPPALTRIPENAEPTRVVGHVDVPDEEKPRSLFQRLTPESTEVPLAGASVGSEVPLAGASMDSVQAEPVPLNPAQESVVFRRADLDEQPEVPEIPADRTRYLPQAAPEIAQLREEQTAPSEVEEWHPREMWLEEELEEEEAQVDQPAEAVHEAELLDDREEDFSADDSVPAETVNEETSVIPAGEVERAIEAGDARRDAERQSWPEHSLTGQFPIVTDDIASNKGQLGVEPDDPDDRRDDPDELTAAAEAPVAEARDTESRGADFRAAQARIAASRTTEAQDAEAESQPAVVQPSAVVQSEVAEPTTAQSVARSAEARSAEAWSAEVRSAEFTAADFTAAEPEQPSVEASEARPAEFFPAEVPVETPAVEKRPAAADFFAPQPVVAEPAAPQAPAAKASKSAPAQPAAERPRSLFEPILGESDDDPQPAETVRQLPPSDDRPFVPTLAPELLARGSNGLPQRPQRPAGGPPPMTSPPLLGPPQPVSPPPLPQKPLRPRPVGFSPSTGGRGETPNPVAPRYQQLEGFNPRSPFGPGSVLPKSDGHAPAADFEVKATLTGRRYFRRGSSSFDDTRADVWFRTEADAQKAGFRPAS